MTRVLLHPFAGVLSAYGMGLADVRALQAAGGRGDARRRVRSPPPKRRSTRSNVRRATRWRRRAFADGAHRREAHAASQVRRHRHDARNRRRRRLPRHRRRIRAPLPPALRIPDARQAAGDRGGRGRGGRPLARRARRRAVVRAARGAAAAAVDQPDLHGRALPRCAVFDRDDLRPGRCDRRAGGDPRGQRDDGRRAGLARDVHRPRRSRPRARRSRAARACDRHDARIRCCSRCSTTSSWRSPSRWA